MAKIILFVDAMEPKEYGRPWKATERGLVESGYPKVTPKVTSEVYTGVSPSENGMGATHSMSELNPHRPQLPTIQEKLEQAGYKVGSFYMPYCLPLQLQSGLWQSTSAQQEDVGQNPLAMRMVNIPASSALHGSDADKDGAYNMRREEIYARSSNMLNILDLAELDVIFVAVRSPDQYTHFQWHEDYRVRLLNDLAKEVARWEVNHDILWWSDHGSEEKKDTFRVNKWLMDKGYLDLDIDLEFNSKFTEEMLSRQPEGQGGSDIENQIAPHSPGVDILPSTQAISMDPYDSCIDIMDDELDKEQLIDELMDTGMYKGVKKTEDQWGEGRFIDHCPDLVTHRADNVVITGNVHPEPIGLGFYRTGVHSAFGAWGTTDESFGVEGDVNPRQLHDVIWQFVTGESSMNEQVMNYVNNMKRQMDKQLEQIE